MRKSDMVELLTECLDVKKGDAGKIYDTFVESIYLSLMKGNVFRIPKVGTLSVTHREETTYRNPQTKELMKKKRHRRLKFSISNKIKEALNS